MSYDHLRIYTELRTGDELPAFAGTDAAALASALAFAQAEIQRLKAQIALLEGATPQIAGTLARRAAASPAI
ncbi:MAG: hypothetical protein ACOY6K_12515 [Pseudomonadota bacterium]